MKSAKTIAKLLNIYPPFQSTGAEVTEIADDFKYLKLRMPLTESNKNFVGTHFGGSLYSIVDPIYMLLLIHILGEEYLVWDKSADIEFITPGTGTIEAEFNLDDEILETILEKTKSHKKFEPEFRVELKNESNETVAIVNKKLWIKKRRNLS